MKEERNPFAVGIPILLAIAGVFAVGRLIIDSAPTRRLRRTFVHQVVPLELISVVPATNGSNPVPSTLTSKSEAIECGPQDAAVIWLRLPPAWLRIWSGTVRDDAGNQYPYTSRQPGNGALALVLTRGYDVLPKTLSIVATYQDRGLELGSSVLKIDGKRLPSPVRAVPATTKPDASLAAYLEPHMFHVEFKPTSPDTSAVGLRLLRTSFNTAPDQSWLFLRRRKDGLFAGDVYAAESKFAHEAEFEIVELKTRRESKDLEFKSAGLLPATAHRSVFFEKPEDLPGPAATRVSLVAIHAEPPPVRSVSQHRGWLYADLRVESKPSDVAPNIWPAAELQVLAPTAEELGVRSADYSLRLVDDHPRMFVRPDETKKSAPYPGRSIADSLAVRVTVSVPTTLARRKVVVPIFPPDPRHSGRRMRAPAT